jgi:NADH:ubiquinone oxidoreductase subunit 2 (subunit N)
VGALSLALGLAAAAGLAPYLPNLDAEEPASSSYLAWTAFFGPALALSLPLRLLPALNAGEGAVFGSTLVALGLVNLGLGTLGAWRTASDADAWRYSFLADWGLALVGLGLFMPEGRAAAYLALLSVVLVRLPLYLWARPVLLGREKPRLGPLNVLLAVMLAGAAPFSGFPVRLLVLHAAVQIAWPLAVPLLAAMLLWAAHAFRLARTVGAPRGRGALGLWLTLALSLGLGLAPGVLRAAGGL